MSRLSGALTRHSAAIQAVAALATVLIALAALIGVKVQIDSAAQLQREQSARDIYREYLNLSISRPEFAAPDYCAMTEQKDIAAYENYVEYLLYTAEQAIDADPDWQRTMADALVPHRDHVCAVDDWSAYSDGVQALVHGFSARQCVAAKKCR